MQSAELWKKTSKGGFRILDLAYSLREMPHSLREVRLLGVNKTKSLSLFKAFPSGEGGQGISKYNLIV